jgi:hypothetical protein
VVLLALLRIIRSAVIYASDYSWASNMLELGCRIQRSGRGNGVGGSVWLLYVARIRGAMALLSVKFFLSITEFFIIPV